MPDELRARTVVRIEAKRRLGPDEQVDDAALVIAPGDPRLTDPFLMLREDWISKAGFDWHPHRGLETVTTVLDGVLEHGDNAGNAGALGPGDMQWMTAGRGIIHRELAYRDEHAHTLQLWLNLPARLKQVETRYQDLLAAVRPRVRWPGVIIDVVSGTVAGRTGLARNHHPVQAATITIDPGAALDYVLPASHRGFAYVLEGRVEIAGRAVASGRTAWVDPLPVVGDTLLPLVVPVKGASARVMVYSGAPIREPVAIGGPFVMNHRKEVEQAFAEFQSGRFGELPRHARLD